jgi:hypothetical protein
MTTITRENSVTMDLKISIPLPVLWDGTFEKNEWGFVNFLIGPNGTGKTLFATELKKQCQKQGMKPRYLNAERLAGLERQQYGNFGSSNLHDGFNISQYQTYKSNGQEYGLSGDAFILLSEKLDLKTKVEATLSQLFDRELTLSTDTGTLRPKLRKKKGETYDMRQYECHGLKELITLLTFLYDDDNNCLIIDEPELHLHPQFQTFLLQHIRQLAGDPRKDAGTKCFFLITHSPFMVDVRTVDDLRQCVVFQPGKQPSFVSILDDDDLYKVKRLLPRLNTHHKQFFFSSAPIFVEGYTDQQLFSLIQERRGRLIGAVGSCLIDVTGKDEMALFYRLCKCLGIESRFIADLDVLFGGNLRQMASQDERCKKYLQEQGLGMDAMTVIGQLEKPLADCTQAVESTTPTASSPSLITQMHDAFRVAEKESDAGKVAAKKRYIMLVGALNYPEALSAAIPDKVETLTYIRGRAKQLIEGFSQAQVHLLQKGELENYLSSFSGNPFSVSNNVKADVFDKERTALLEEFPNESELRSRYGDLIEILDRVTQTIRVSVEKQLVHHLADWVHKVQSAHRRNAPVNNLALENDPYVDWKVYSRLLTLISFQPDGNGFVCRIRLKAIIDPHEREISFSAQNVPTRVVLPDAPKPG